MNNYYHDDVLMVPNGNDQILAIIALYFQYVIISVEIMAVYNDQIVYNHSIIVRNVLECYHVLMIDLVSNNHVQP